VKSGLKARFHDIDEMAGFGAELVELHLTDADVDLPYEGGPHDVELAVHCPEYWHGELVDPASLNAGRRALAADVVNRSLDKARLMAPLFRDAEGARPLVVLHPGGMSLEPVTQTRPLLDALLDCLSRIDADGVELLLENMPPFPWYYGGQWHSNIFCDPREIDGFLARWAAEGAAAEGGGMCLDLSHAKLWCNHAGTDLDEFIRILLPRVRHLHVADATGVDGEGVQIDEGEIDFARTLAHFGGVGLASVPEVWYGHVNDCEGFRIALARLARYWPS